MTTTKRRTTPIAKTIVLVLSVMQSCSRALVAVVLAKKGCTATS